MVVRMIGGVPFLTNKIDTPESPFLLLVRTVPLTLPFFIPAEPQYVVSGGFVFASSNMIINFRICNIQPLIGIFDQRLDL